MNRTRIITISTPHATRSRRSDTSSLPMKEEMDQQELKAPVLPFNTGSQGLLPPNKIIQFDPSTTSPSEDEEEDEEEVGEDNNNGRALKKRKSTPSLRANLSYDTGYAPPPIPTHYNEIPDFSIPNQAPHLPPQQQFQPMPHTTLAPQQGSSHTMVMVDEEDKEKGRRKIQIEYIEEKSKRHITFSKRKAGIMKKVSRIYTFVVLSLCRIVFLTQSLTRLTSSLLSPALKSFCSLSPSQAGSTPLPPKSSNRSSKRMNSALFRRDRSSLPRVSYVKHC